MRRDTRNHEHEEKNKNIFYITGAILGVGIIAFILTFVLYGNSMEENSNIGSSKIAGLMQESGTDVVDTKSASTEMGKTVEESKNEITNNTTSTTPKTNTTKATNTVNENKDTKKETKSTANKETSKQETTKQEEEAKQEKVELSFAKPVEGEIVKGYAKDNLVYSETLMEWSTHLGLDIKAEKTTVVKAAEAGKIKSIKNDPRYGLSIIIEHQDGYETLYANLLTSEFVQVGEEVKKGQSIGTVGNTATFEIADDAHLHFEISKDGENIDPTGLIK